MKLSFTELHSPIFHAGKNFRDKVFVDSETALELIIKTFSVGGLREIDIPFIQLVYKGKATLLPMTSVNHITVEAGMIERPTNTYHTQDVVKFQGAQVETPQSHVFQGQGKGKGVGKASKIQGE